MLHNESVPNLTREVQQLTLVQSGDSHNRKLELEQIIFMCSKHTHEQEYTDHFEVLHSTCPMYMHNIYFVFIYTLILLLIIDPN